MELPLQIKNLPNYLLEETASIRLSESGETLLSKNIF